MPTISLEIAAFHVAASVLLFFCVNWIGKHAVDFGYTSTTLFDEPAESAALNFLIKTLAPAVFTVIVSAVLISYGADNYRILIYHVAFYYYAVRASAIFFPKKQELVNWNKFLLHSIAGIIFAKLAYDNLILPKKSLIPDLNSAGNEVWLAITGFIYAVANKIPTNKAPSARRKNTYISNKYKYACANFHDIIDNSTPSKSLKLVIYAIIIFEDYARPSTIRNLERFIFWRPKSTGVMQVKSDKTLSDQESVEVGVSAIVNYWNLNTQDNEYLKCYETIAFHNKDSDYISRIIEIMEVIALRVDIEYKDTWDNLFR